MNSRLLDQRSLYYVVFLVLLLPALLINLDVHNLFVHTDESRRALVALEMILSGDYITPTINGEFYYNKPPLYNWVIALSFHLFGEYSAFALRFPVVVATILYGAIIFFGFRRILGADKSALVAIATITSGRILFYDSFLGLIDIAFSTLIFANFLIFFRLADTQRYFLYFSLSYFLMAIAYLMKGLPPIVFQFFTLLAWVIYTNDWKRVFSPSHLVSVLFFLVPVGIYYAFYLNVNDHSIQTLVETLWTESSKRTVAEHGILESVKAIISFPFENMYHFAPWTLFLLAFFKKGVFKSIWRESFPRFAMLAFGLNIIVYWTSPEVYPRYLFMFLPLLFALCFKALEYRSERFSNNLEKVFLVLILLACLTPVLLVVQGRGIQDQAFFVKLLIISFLLIVFVVLYITKKEFRFILLGCFLLVLRLGFDWFALPERNPEGNDFEREAMEVAEITKGQPLYIYRTFVHDGTSFIIEREREEILGMADAISNPGYYIVFSKYAQKNGYSSEYTFNTMANDYELSLIYINADL